LCALSRYQTGSFAERVKGCGCGPSHLLQLLASGLCVPDFNLLFAPQISGIRRRVVNVKDSLQNLEYRPVFYYPDRKLNTFVNVENCIHDDCINHNRRVYLKNNVTMNLLL